MRGAEAGRRYRHQNKQAEMSSQDKDDNTRCFVAPKRTLTKRHSSSNLSGMLERSTGNVMNVSRINALRNSISVHNDAVAKILLSSKESAEKKQQIESAFRVCKEAFFDLSSACLYMLENNEPVSSPSLGDIKDAVAGALSDFHSALPVLASGACAERGDAGDSPSCAPRTFASVVGAGGPRVHVARGPSFEVPRTTNLLIVPMDDKSEKLCNSKDTRDALVSAVKPSDFDLRVKRISSARGNGVRIEAHSVNLTKMMDSKELARAGFRVERETKFNPRLIIHGVPCRLTTAEVESEIVALNLTNHDGAKVKVLYRFPPKENRSTTSCIIEVSPDVRNLLLKEKHIYINYSACRFSDHVRVLQCFKCLAFGHCAKDCKLSALCGHCAGEHELRDCTRRGEAASCGNCRRWHTNEERSHSALDGDKCPILRRKLLDRIKLINYG